MEHQDKIKFILNRIQKGKPESVGTRAHNQGDVVYYESGDSVAKGIAMVNGNPGGALYFSDGNWCYSWQAINEKFIPEDARF